MRMPSTLVWTIDYSNKNRHFVASLLLEVNDVEIVDFRIFMSFNPFQAALNPIH
jgi:hypothetical protein